MDRRKFLQVMGVGAAASVFAPGVLKAAEEDAKRKALPWSGSKLLIAHRGASAYAPENTIPAYQLAIKQGADLVEQDLQITKDGVLVCMHDTTLEATTNVEDVFPDRFREKVVKGKKVKTWPVYEFTLKEVKSLKAGSRIDGQYPATQIPTWQEAIDEIRGKAGLCPETKGPELYGKLGLNMEKLVADMLKKNGLDKRGADPKTPVLMQSFSKDGLLRLRENGVDLPMLLLESAHAKSLDKVIKLAIENKFEVIGPYKDDCNKANVKQAHDADIQVIPYTFQMEAIDKQFGKDLPAEMSYYLYDIGIDGMFTNNPDKFPRKKIEKAVAKQ